MFAFSSSLFLILFGALVGDFTYYTLGSFILITVIMYSMFAFTNRSLILVLVAVFLLFRYIPIVKYNQPLFADSAADLATAMEFEKRDKVEILSPGHLRVRWYSGWPFIHTLAIAIHDITGLSLFDVFTYFPPLVAISSLLFIYLLANQIFNRPRIGILAGLMFATFSVNMFWQNEMIRQNLGYSLMFLAIYLYIKGRTSKKIKIVALSLFAFGILPIAHHLTTLAVFYIMFATLFLTLLSRLLKTVRPLGAYKSHIDYSFTLILCFFVGVSMFFYWSTYAQDVILEMFSEKSYHILMGLTGVETGVGKLPTVAKKLESPDIYDISSFARLLFYIVATFYGIFIVTKEKNRHKRLLYGFLFAPSALLLVFYFIDKTMDDRHILFLIIPMFLLSAKAIHNLDKKILVACLLIILIPTPFKLFRTFEPAPTFIYDNSSTQSLLMLEEFVYKENELLTAASHIVTHTNSNILADYYTGISLVFQYNPYKIYIMRKKLPQLEIDKSIFVIHIQYYQVRVQFFSKSPAVQYMNSSLLNRIYDNYNVIGWKGH